MSSLPTTIPIIIIGAGQAGLAAAHELIHRGFTPRIDFIILDSGDSPGGAWRHRWDSLTLGKAHGIADLPGLPMNRPNPKTPASQLVSDYYGSYEEKFDLQVVRPARVIAVHNDDGTAANHADTDLLLTVLHDGNCGTIRTQLVINATGTWTHPWVPWVPGIADFPGRQLHTVNYIQKEDFFGEKVLVIGGGLSAVQFLLELNSPGSAEETIWATRRPPNFTRESFDQRWGYNVEQRVREATLSGRRPESVVRNTGIPPWPEYLAAVESGVLISRGMIDRLDGDTAHWGDQSDQARRDAENTGADALAQPTSWQPFPPGHLESIDTIFWNTGFRPALTHLAPLHLREVGGGIRMADDVSIFGEPRVLLAGYGSTASTVGANRAGRLAGKTAAERLNELKG